MFVNQFFPPLAYGIHGPSMKKVIVLRNRLAGATAAAALVVALAPAANAAPSPTPAPDTHPTAAGGAGRPQPMPAPPLDLHRAQARGRAASARAATLFQSDNPAPTTAQCLSLFAQPCYSPGQLAHAYQIDDAHAAGYLGTGATIAVIEGDGGDPNIQADLNTYDTAYNLPPTTVKIDNFGPDVPSTVGNANEEGWAWETAADVETAHWVAPLAKIIVVRTRDVEILGLAAGFKVLTQAVAWVSTHEHVDAISMSFGAPEQVFSDELNKPGDYSSIYAAHTGLQVAHDHHVSLFASAGDTGAAGWNLNGSGNGYYPYPIVNYPASDPSVTGVGGTYISLDANGNRTAPDTAWTVDNLGLAGGGGLSSAWREPEYQEPVSPVLQAASGKSTHLPRGVPEVAANASCNSYNIVYATDPIGGSGWAALCGTSLSAPLIAALATDGAAVAHHPLGNINGKLYALTTGGAQPQAAGITDVTTGCNSDKGVIGYCAGPGYDLATGVGTIGNATTFIRALVHADHDRLGIAS
jgi:subtilase family serine protease